MMFNSLSGSQIAAELYAVVFSRAHLVVVSN
jgi:hypothetical protein